MAATTAPAEATRAREDGPRIEVGFRYGAVLALSLTVVVFIIATPAGDWSRAFALALEFTALVVVVVTSSERERVREHRALLLAAAAAAIVIAVGLGALPATITFAIAALVAFLIPANLAGGLIRLVRRKGVTLQVVAGALAIYLLLGLTFAYLISFAAHVGAHPYFAQGGNGSASERMYYSFTALTTTGFGDLSPARSGGRALAVLEMLVGQLYLVTVIGVLVGDIAGRRRGIES
ncbi:MAG: potassium channel family protein [Thermoleophilaceae bacterium]